MGRRESTSKIMSSIGNKKVKKVKAIGCNEQNTKRKVDKRTAE